MLRQARTSPSEWKKILVTVYGALRDFGASDLIVFGSQAMSLQMTRAVASKDLDLIATDVNLEAVRKIAKMLQSTFSYTVANYSYNVGSYDGREYPVFSIYLTHSLGKPFVIEIFQTFLGHDVRKLTPYDAFKDRWGINMQTLGIEAIIGARLAFRPPEGITPFNARRLNSFINDVKTKIRWPIVNKFIIDFDMGERIAHNLETLRKKHNISISGTERLKIES